jgi:metal transporter CNNM
MVVTFPLSYPVSKLLDCMLGDEVGTIYNRDRLIELIRMGCTTESNGNMDDFRIVTGALEYTTKTVGEVMTKAEVRAQSV